MRTLPFLALLLVVSCSSTSPASDAGACGPDSCAGCCELGACQPGKVDSACGTGGGDCSACNLQNHCAGREGQYRCVQQPCLTTCDGGCCDGETGTCQPGGSPPFCGRGDVWCEPC
ncbi:MAG: hypothetical protein AB1938_17465 [Myxococcota bacterium]